MSPERKEKRLKVEHAGMVAQELALLADPSKHAEAAKIAVDMQLQVSQASEAAQQVWDCHWHHRWCVRGRALE